jgi:SnoaL-like domain
MSSSAVRRSVGLRHSPRSHCSGLDGGWHADVVADTSADDLAAFYRAYNAHDFDALDTFVADDVAVNGTQHGLAAYISGLYGVVRAFPDYRWDLQHLLGDAPYSPW